MKSEQPSDFGGNCQYSFPACCGMRHSFCRTRSVVFRQSVWTSFFCPCPHLRRCCSAHSPKKEVVAKSYPIQPVIQLEPAFGQQKSRHINVYRPIQKDRLIPCGFWFHNDVTGFEIQSRNCLLRLSVADSSKQFQKWIFRSRSPYCPVIRKPIGNYVGYRKSRQCKAGLRPAKRLWAWHSLNFLWVVIKPINGGFRSGIPVSILPESWFLGARIFKKRRYFLFAYRRRVRRKVVLLDSVKICNWLCFSLENVLLYGRKQVFVNTFKKVFE